MHMPLLALSAGSILSFAAIVLPVGNRLTPTAHAVATSQPPPGVAAVQGSLAAAPRRPVALPQGLDVLVAASEGSSAGEAAEDEGDSPQARAPQPAFADRWRGLLDAHDAEPRDSAWAQRWTETLKPDFDALAPNLGFSVRGIDCRSTSCTAELQWPSYDAATEHWQELLHHRYSANCAVAVDLRTPERPEDPYTARVLLRNCQALEQ